MKSPPFDAMIFAAGLGTRLKPLTIYKPKALVEVGGKTLLLHLLLKLKQYNVQRVIINIHHLADQIIKYIHENHKFGMDVYVSDERDNLLNTGGGLKKASVLFSKTRPILIHSVDVISNLKINSLLNRHLQSDPLATLVVRNRKTQRYLLFDKDYTLCGWTNTATDETKLSRKERIINRLAFSSIHVINPSLFSLIEEKGAFSIIDLYLRLAKTHMIKAFVDDSDIWLDTGRLCQLTEAEKIFQDHA